jgi:S-adenosyl methyltransferase
MRDLSGWPLADPSSHRRAPRVTGQPAAQVSARRQEPAIDTTVAHSARVWNRWLGGKDNYPVDRATAEQYSAIFPGITASAVGCRAFLVRAVRYLAGEARIRQFLDVGIGLPLTRSTHEVAQQIAPESRIVYADNDPLSLAHARALLTSNLQGTIGYVEADLHEPGEQLPGAQRRHQRG